MNAYDVVIKPIITDKITGEGATKKYAFYVNVKATKTQIKAAVEKIFEVKVKSVNTVNVRGKLKRQGRTEGYTSKKKKAYVQLTAESKAIAELEMS